MKTSPSLRAFGVTAALICAFTTPVLRAQLGPVSHAAPGAGEKWAATWSASAHAAFGGSAGLRFAIPNPTTDGAVNQTMRMIVKPDLWGKTMRLRFSNLMGTQPVTFGRVTVGLQTYGANILGGSIVPVSFNGGASGVTIPVGQSVYSDGVLLPFLQSPDDPVVQGRNLAVSFFVQGKSGPITDHAGTFQVSYLAGPETGDHTQDENDAAFPYTNATTLLATFFIDAVDVAAPDETSVVCCFGDSITDRAFMTLNAPDSWVDDLSRRLHAVYGNRVSVVNEGISGNTVSNPARTGQAAVDRLDRDVLGLSGLTAVVWLEGTNDLSVGRPASDVTSGYENVVGRLHAKGIKVIGAAITSTLVPPAADIAGAGGTSKDTRRKEVNTYIRTSGLFDSVADMDAATLDPATGAMQPQFAAHSSGNPAPDWTHPGRAGFQVMAFTIDLNVLAPAVAQ